MKINLTPPPKTYLFFAESDEDAVRLDEYAAQKKLEYTKIGDKSYVGFFREYHETVYEQLKVELGISGRMYWVQLPPPEETK